MRQASSVNNYTHHFLAKTGGSHPPTRQYWQYLRDPLRSERRTQRTRWLECNQWLLKQANMQVAKRLEVSNTFLLGDEETELPDAA
jgi:hypothetical protein